jgi:hypothetical protein
MDTNPEAAIHSIKMVWSLSPAIIRGAVGPGAEIRPEYALIRRLAENYQKWEKPLRSLLNESDPLIVGHSLIALSYTGSDRPIFPSEVYNRKERVRVFSACFRHETELGKFAAKLVELIRNEPGAEDCLRRGEVVIL